MSRYGRYLWEPKSEESKKRSNYDNNSMKRYNESTSRHYHASSRVASIVDALDDEHGQNEPSGRYTQYLKNDTSKESQLSQKLMDGVETVKKLIEEKKQEKKDKMELETDYHEKEIVADIEMKSDPEQFLKNRRSSQEFQTLVWNALNADWMMDLDKRAIEENDSTYNQEDIQV